MQMSKNDGIAILLANRHYIYGLLQHIFGNEPNHQLFEAITSEHTRNALKLCFVEEESDLNNYLDLLDKAQEAMEKDENTLDYLKSEYTFLFIGPNKLPAPPWESVYRNEERTIFQESTLLVRKAYLKYGFLPSNYPHEADDHLAMELDFMTHLSKLALDQFESGDIEGVKRALASQLEFLEEHLLFWIADFSKDIQNSKTHYFYPQFATLTAQILHMDKVFVQEILEAI